MRFYSKKRILAILFVVWVSILAACVSSNSSENPTSTVAYSLILYKTISPTNIVTPETDNDVTRIPSPSPTLTPITYTVVEGDTMLEIALHYGIKLEDLLASNPNVDRTSCRSRCGAHPYPWLLSLLGCRKAPWGVDRSPWRG